MNKKGKNRLLVILGMLGLLGLGTGLYFVLDIYITENKAVIALTIGISLAALAFVIYLCTAFAVRNTKSAVQEILRTETRPILSYLGRVLTKAETSSAPKAEAIINNMLMSPAASKSVKISLDTAKKNILPYEGIGDTEDHGPIIIIRPFIFANYGKSIAVGINIALDGEMVSFRSDYVIEPNSKIQLEINDTIKFNKKMGFFTLSYFDVYGNEFEVLLNGTVEYAKEESSDLDRDVYFYYVDGFSEVKK